MTTFQDPPPQSRRAVRQSERGERASEATPATPAEGAPYSFDGVQDPQTLGTAPATEAPAETPHSGRRAQSRVAPPEDTHSSQPLANQPAPGQSNAAPPGETAEQAAYRMRDFSPEGRRSAGTRDHSGPLSPSASFAPPGNPVNLDYQTQGVAPASHVAESAPLDDTLNHTLSRRELREMRAAAEAEAPPLQQPPTSSALPEAIDTLLNSGPIEIPTLAPPPGQSQALAEAMAEFDLLTRSRREAEARARDAQVASLATPIIPQVVAPASAPEAPAPEAASVEDAAPIPPEQLSFAQESAPEAPVASAPEPALPVASVPVDSVPFPSVPVSSVPVSSVPVSSAPVAPTSVASAPFPPAFVASVPVADEPVATEPVTSEPVATQPVTSEPVTSEPVAFEPVDVVPVASAPMPPPPVNSVPVTPVPFASAPAPVGYPQTASIPSPAAPPASTPEPEQLSFPQPPIVNSVEQPPVLLTPTFSDQPSSAEAPAVDDPAQHGGRSPRASGHWRVQAAIEDEELPYENTLSRTVGANTSAITTSALVLPSVPSPDGILNNLTATGEILVTGTIDLPRSLGSTGAHPSRVDNSDFEDDPLDSQVAAPDSAPIRAIRAVSSNTSTRGVIETKRPSGTRLLTGVIIVASALCVGLVGLLVYALATHKL